MDNGLVLSCFTVLKRASFPIDKSTALFDHYKKGIQ